MTQEQINQIISWYQIDDFSIGYIAKNLLHCRTSTVSKVLKDNNIKITSKNNKGRTLNKELEKDIVKLYTENHYSQKQLAEKYNCSTHVIHNVLVRNNIPIVTQPKINQEQNDRYFDKIDNERKAYWLGFIFADGGVSGNTLTIEIHERDKDLLEQFKKDLNLNSKISIRHRKSTTVCAIRVTSPHLAQTLSTYGIVPNKTKLAKQLPKVDIKLLPHFMRGLIDGDGWISIDKLGHYHIGFVSHYESVCEDFKENCNVLTNNLCDKIKVTNKGGKNKTPCFQIQGQNTIKCLVNILYKDNTICLSRKYRLVEPLLD